MQQFRIQRAKVLEALIKVALSLAAATVLLATPAWSADNSVVDQTQQTGADVIIELGIGGIIQPEYEGSDDYEVSPWPIIGFGYLAIPGLFAIGSPEAQIGGFAIGPSFNYTSDRDFNDDPDLFGLDDVDAAFEAGLRASYEWTNAEVWAEARYAFGGADGVVGEFGVNAVARPTPDSSSNWGLLRQWPQPTIWRVISEYRLENSPAPASELTPLIRRAASRAQASEDLRDMNSGLPGF